MLAHPLLIGTRSPAGEISGLSRRWEKVEVRLMEADASAQLGARVRHGSTTGS